MAKKWDKWTYLLGDYFSPELASQLRTDDIGKYSLTNQQIAEQIAQTVLSLDGIDGRSVITDAMASVGGNTWQFARLFIQVNANELDSTRNSHLRHNVKLLGLKDRVRVSSLNYLKSYKKFRQDVVWLDPPWLSDVKQPFAVSSIPAYKRAKRVRIYLQTAKGHTTEVSELVGKLHGRTKYVVIKLPFNYDIRNMLSVVKDKFELIKRMDYKAPDKMMLLYFKGYD